MVGIGLKFDLGRYHATPWLSNVNDGLVEWPPSEWRLLRAIYAVSRTHSELHSQRQTIEMALRGLAAAPAPKFWVPPSVAAHTRHYFPSRAYSPSRSGTTDRVLDAFRALSPKAEVQVWWDVKLDEEAIAGLRSAVRRLGYLGRSESVCTARVLDQDAREPQLNTFSIDETHSSRGEDAGKETVELLCLDRSVDALEALSISTGQLRGERRLHPLGARPVVYVLGVEEPSRRPKQRAVPRPELACFRIVGGDRPGVFEAVSAGEALRKAVQGLYGRQNGDATSPVFSGRAGDEPRRDQHAHAHYLGLPDHDDRRLDRLFVWAPGGFGPREVSALASLSTLRHWALDGSLQLTLTSLGDRNELNIGDLLGPSESWQSITPFGLTRHPKRRADGVVDSPEEQVRREWTLRHPDGEARLLTVTVEKSGREHEFRSTRPGKSSQRTSSVWTVRLGFKEPVSGPIALGALSHFGLGLFVPASP